MSEKRSVALEYQGSGAPKVIAKGSGSIAEQILKLASENNIPIQQDNDLVELLSQVELDQEIPEQLYSAVAQVLIFAYEISGKEIPKPNAQE